MVDLDGLKAEIEKALQDMGVCNVLIAGRTGVGKSTLINSVFHGRMAATGQGKPVTTTTRFISKKGVPLGLWDTRGLEMADLQETLDDLVALVKRRAADRDPERHIHVAWLCVLEGSRRVECAEQHLCRMLAQHMPVLGVITQAESDDGFRARVQELLPEAGNVVRVRAIPKTLDNGQTLEPMGLEDLIEATMELLPEGVRCAFTSAGRASMRHKREQARRAVFSSASAAAAAGAIPIPFANAAVLVQIQVRMLARVSALYVFDVTGSYLRALVTASVGPAAAAVGGKAIVGSLLKLIPGGGTVLGGAISAATAATLTTVLGQLYVAVLDAAFAKTARGSMPEPAKVAKEFGKRAKKARGDGRLGRLRRGIGRLRPFRK